MYLFIDILSFPQKVILGLYEQNHFFVCQSLKITPEKMLLGLDKFLSKEAVKISDISGIIVFMNNGGFSNTRLACVYGNMLAELLRVQVVACPLRFSITSLKSYRRSINKLFPDIIEGLIANPRVGLILPKYNKEPNITLSKQSV